MYAFEVIAVGWVVVKRVGELGQHASELFRINQWGQGRFELLDMRAGVITLVGDALVSLD